MKSEKKVAIDYETNALRPYNKDTSILSVAIGTEQRVLSFPINHMYGWRENVRERINELWKDFLIHSNHKIVHYLNFEAEWSAVKYGDEAITSSPWIDTMGQAYLLDDRKGMSSLDTQILLEFGFNLKSLSPGVDRANITAVPLETLLLYNGLDTKWTFLLEQSLGKRIRAKGMQKLADYIFDMNVTTVLAQTKGLKLDWKLLSEYEKNMNADIHRILTTIESLPEVKQFERERMTRFNPNTPKDVFLVMHKYLGRKEVVDEKKKSGYATGATVLQDLAEKGVKLAQLLLEHRGIVKIKNSFIDCHLKGKTVYDDDRVHTRYNTTLVSTGRLSSSDPNIQQQPKRKWGDVRNVFIPEEGCVIVSNDYGQIEARVLGMESHDKEFCKALWGGFDVHAFWGKRVLEIQPALIDSSLDRDDVLGDQEDDASKNWFKDWRAKIKNGLVFPWFYGATMRKSAGMIGMSEGTGNRIYGEFWDTYRGVKRWQDRIMKKYYRGWVLRDADWSEAVGADEPGGSDQLAHSRRSV